MTSTAPMERAREDRTAKLRVQCMGISVDGFAAGPNQDLQNPLGVRGFEIMNWFIQTRVWRTMHGQADGETGIDNAMAEAGFENIGAWILGRNMFGPVRGPWPDESWRGWWGEEPPYHTPVFVLTHHPRPPLVMQGGTTFHFVTEGIHAAYERAMAAAEGRDVRLGGGALTVRQFVRARLVDELHLVQRPVLLGTGEPLFEGLDFPALGYAVSRQVAGERGTHLFLHRER